MKCQTCLYNINLPCLKKKYVKFKKIYFLKLFPYYSYTHINTFTYMYV